MPVQKIGRSWCLFAKVLLQHVVALCMSEAVPIVEYRSRASRLLSVDEDVIVAPSSPGDHCFLLHSCTTQEQ
jgi:hypothetical protein